MSRDTYVRKVVNNDFLSSNRQQRILMLECGHKRYCVPRIKPYSQYCSTCKRIADAKLVEQAIEQNYDLATQQIGEEVCKHGLTKCIECKTGKPQITEVDINDVPF